jgi:hypothetical protein
MPPVLLEVGRQQHRIRRQTSRLHQAHGRMHAERTRLIGGRCGNAPPGVFAQAPEAPMCQAGDRIGHGHRFVPPPSAHDDGGTSQFRVAQQLDRREKRVHVEMGNDPGGRCRHNERPLCDRPS